MLKFGTSGIRGIFNNDFSPYFINKLCFSLYKNLNDRICLGYDTRNSSFIFSKKIISGLSYYKKKVTNLGCLATPIIAYTTKKFNYNWGLDITASHNPPEFIGIKIFNNEGLEIDRNLEEKIEQSFDDYKYNSSLKKTRKSFNYININYYSKDIINYVTKTKKKLRILIDCGNGATINYTTRILSKLGHNVFTINSHPSIQSIGRILEPNFESLKELSNFVKENKYDICIAHDGDGDRIALIDDKGNIIEDQLLSSLAIRILCSKYKHKTVIISTNTSQSVKRTIKKMGLNLKTERIGKTFLKINDNTVLSTEPSKVTYSNWGKWEDGIFSAIIISQYLSNCKLKLSEIINDLPYNYYYQKNIKLKNIDKSILIEKITKKYSKYFIDYSDGFKVLYNKSSFILFRISGTEPKIRIYVDSNNKAISDNLLMDGINLIENINV